MIAKFCFDISAMVIMLVVLEYNLRRNVAKSNRNRVYFVLVFVALLSNVATISNTAMQLCGIDNIRLQIIFQAVDSIMVSLIAPCYIVYIVLFTGNERLFLEKPRNAVIFLIPELAEIVYLLSLYLHYIFTGHSFETASWEIIRGWIFLGISLCYAVVGILYIRYLKKGILGSAHVVLAIPIVLTTLSLGLRELLPHTQSVFFVVSMCFLLLLLLNRTSSSLIDMNTGFKTQTAFVDEMKMAQYIGREAKLILIKVINYNDALNRSGYDVLNDAIVQMSKSITRCVTDNLIDGEERFYNDEGSFVVIVPKKHSANAELLAHNIAKNVMNGIGLGSLDFQLMANVCLVSFPEDAQDVDTILLLLEDMGHHGHSLRVMSAADLTSTADFEIRKQMNAIIDRAEKNGYFSVYYQPIYDVKKKAFLSAEALVRLNDPEHGFISPGVFIPVAEKTGTIHKIGSFVLEEVMKFIGSDEFKELGVKYIEINLSAAQCLRINLSDEIKFLSAKYNVDPSCVNLEITETAECYSQDILQDNIRKLHNAGYTFSLDDFGTGYSNLMRMAVLPLDIIKLDRAFVIMDDNEKFHSIIKNMVHLFKEMGLKVLVEGIETIQMVEKFVDIDVDYIQGFYYSKPLPKEEYINFLMAHKD